MSPNQSQEIFPVDKMSIAKKNYAWNCQFVIGRWIGKIFGLQIAESIYRN